MYGDVLSLNKAEKAIVAMVGSIMEGIGELLFKDDYPDYLDDRYERTHHYHVGRALKSIGGLLKTESEPPEPSKKE